MDRLRNLYINSRLLKALIAIILLFLLGFALSPVFVIAQVALAILAIMVILDGVQLFRARDVFFARRQIPQKFSNGDANPVDIYVESRYPMEVQVVVMDEAPFQFQLRDQKFKVSLKPSEYRWIHYELTPVKRGEYEFGKINIYTSSSWGLLSRRFRFEETTMVKVYPSFIQMRKYELLAISQNLTEAGIKKLRRRGNNREFEQIEQYVAGDDYRSINWKATARRNQLMVNHYQDERSQHIYSVVDKGRVMKMPFNGMSLLDYAINASLVMSNIAVRKGDKAGLITFQHKPETIIPASSRSRQMNLIMEGLYRQKTGYKESSFDTLYAAVRRNLSQRSLLIIYTNFESVHAMHRQLPYLRLLARQHLVLCVIFRNTEVEALMAQPAETTEEIYTKGIAEQLMHEKEIIRRELQVNGIHALLTAPENLSVNTINKYLELKSRGLI
ncbi:MAG: DUF58 domain-containing protein [Owenweeksia sp.]|nr:DUF58 domain-containing protein [Owenweeksia sp.]MBF99942.1 DUF58 domain-containing protein [Owenweeksia sp.]HBF21662.1 DUF58 domain-containing protein [Cryomorphaceae bacterium]|tara:strand:- start:3491 stop:4822 length:1332 start_codon:yes stop_codon:yes gene_type:complete